MYAVGRHAILIAKIVAKFFTQFAAIYSLNVSRYIRVCNTVKHVLDLDPKKYTVVSEHLDIPPTNHRPLLC